MSPGRGEAGGFTVLDWIGAVLALGGTLFCWQLPFLTAPAYARMFEDFGGALPLLTRLVLSTWFPLALGLLPLVPLAAGAAGRMRLGVRRALVVGAFVLSLAVSGACLVALELPLFRLAGAVAG